ncbi:hypothetical protein RirG_144340 [Rhizophagus irregularis DAOM 197198w]|uniref:Uncharacterized protein n=1 Tax=Rhizophagus irregularis (strain DAOM 197198w) TaxID=1432141 RepID=A0A015JBI1_RHIIW|nr:hypothetical protein RirG_144340 [Rhizophagus irregularis DAOM 197198w]
METLKKFKRPLVNLGNSRTTKYRKKIKASENQKKNGQTLFQLLSKKSSQENLGSELQDIDNQNEGELKEKNGHKMRLKATQYYFHLLERGHSKLNASQMVAEMLNRGVWFARCVRSWAKAFKNYGDIPKDNRRQYFKGSSLIDDEDIQLKVASYLRQHKFDVTVNSFCNFVNEEILPSIGIENKTTIR